MWTRERIRQHLRQHFTCGYARYRGPDMAFTMNDNRGSLFRNDRRQTENHPHAKGKALIGGRWYWVSAWTKEPQAVGEKYQSLSFQLMTDEQVEQYIGGNTGGAPQQGRGFAKPHGFGQRKPAPVPP